MIENDRKLVAKIRLKHLFTGYRITLIIFMLDFFFSLDFEVRQITLVLNRLTCCAHRRKWVFYDVI